jgi:DNA-directed RNA polymerase specialized sigma24 family protein
MLTAKTSSSELRIRLRRLQAETGRSFIRSIDPVAGKAELERALLAIDTFPRRALLLRVFEKLAIEDIGVLLNADRESVKTATTIGLIQLARNLAGDRKSRTAHPVKPVSFDALQQMTV